MRMEIFRKSLAAEDREVVERAAHTLKGHAANLGAEPFRSISHEMEKAGRKGDFQLARSMLKDFEGEHKRLVEALQNIDWEEVREKAD